MDGLKRYVNDDRFRVDGDKNMRLLAFAFTIVFVWTGPKPVKKYVFTSLIRGHNELETGLFPPP